MPETTTPERLDNVTDVNFSYGVAYQPRYNDADALAEVEGALEMIEGVTTPDNIERVKNQYARIARGEDNSMVLIVGPCSEQLLSYEDDGELIENYENLLRIGSGYTKVQALRACGQGAKPRSKEFENLGDGNTVPSYYGDMVNSADPNDRTPDPDRLIIGAEQALRIQKALTDITGSHVNVSHEALIELYERKFLTTESRGTYLTSCDIPWIGKRTNDPSGLHVNMLQDIQNPVGIKIGADDDASKIQELSTKLNPNAEPGKLIFVMRFGERDLDEAHPILDAISEHAPGALILCDPMHGNTINLPNGEKTREIPAIISEIRTLAEMCRYRGLRLHGLHLEASGRSDREECVDIRGTAPRDTSLVDPELNNSQLLSVLEETRECFYDERKIRQYRQVANFVIAPQ